MEAAEAEGAPAVSAAKADVEDAVGAERVHLNVAASQDQAMAVAVVVEDAGVMAVMVMTVMVDHPLPCCVMEAW